MPTYEERPSALIKEFKEILMPGRRRAAAKVAEMLSNPQQPVVGSKKNTLEKIDKLVRKIEEKQTIASDALSEVECFLSEIRFILDDELDNW